VRKGTLLGVGAAGLLAFTLALAREKPKIVGIEAKPPGGPKAVATIEPRSGSSVVGKAIFRSEGGTVSLSLELRNLPPGLHAVHLHEKGDCSAPDASSAGGHWNPTQADHGEWGHPPFHLGDIGNIAPQPDGTASLSFSTEEWTLGDGSIRDIAGKSLVVHEKPDDFKTQPTGGAGGRIGCGVIRLEQSP
jgi:Cu-Zn family superoxide dismutase